MTFFDGEHHDVLEIDKPLSKICVKHKYFCYYLLYARLHVSTYLSGHHQAFLQLSQRMLSTCCNPTIFTLNGNILILLTCWNPNRYIASFDSIVRRPDDDRISRSKHVASHTINNNKNSCSWRISYLKVCLMTFCYCIYLSNFRAAILLIFRPCATWNLQPEQIFCNCRLTNNIPYWIFRYWGILHVPHLILFDVISKYH